MVRRKNLICVKWDFIIPALGVSSLLVSCILISSKKYFWNDELYSYLLLSAPSFTKMLAAFHDKINNTPLLYFLLGWFWDKIFGSSELSLRLFSSLGMCMALIIVWNTLRRTYSFWPTTIGVLVVFCTSDLIIFQNAEARMYGLFLGVSALSLYLYDRICKAIEPSNKLLFLTFCSQVALLHTHLHGAFYSGAILFSLMIADGYLKRFRLKVYMSVIFSWLSLIFYLPSFLNQAEAGTPRTWISTPSFYDLVNFSTSISSLLFMPSVLPLLVLIGGLHFAGKTLINRPESIFLQRKNNSNTEVPLLVFAISFIIAPIIIWVISRVIKPIFWPKYLIPTTLSWTILLGYVSSRLINFPDVRNIFKYVRSKELSIAEFSVAAFNATCLVILASFMLYQPIKIGMYFYKQVIPGTSDGMYGYTGLPIVAQVSSAFLERIYHTNTPERYFFILDWKAAVDKNSGLFGPQEFKHLTALKRNFPKKLNNIISSEDFLKTYDNFLVVDYVKYICKCPIKPFGLKTTDGVFVEDWDYRLHCPQWVEMRLLNKGYKITNLGKVDNGRYCLLLVNKIIKN